MWKDERYTNTTSLIEDATAKIEEMSRPYKAYTAEVVDLAKASEKYKDILSYGIGDTVTLVSKKTRTKEKQRIVKSRNIRRHRKRTRLRFQMRERRLQRFRKRRQQQRPRRQSQSPTGQQRKSLRTIRPRRRLKPKSRHRKRQSRRVLPTL